MINAIRGIVNRLIGKNRLGHYRYKAIRDVIIWFFFGVVFGLLQLWISILIQWLEKPNVDMYVYLQSGVILFFCSGIVTSSASEILFEDDIDKKRRRNIVFHILLPMIFVVFITTVYCRIIAGHIDLVKNNWCQLGSFAYALAYSIITRFQLNYVRFRRIEYGGASC